MKFNHTNYLKIAETLCNRQYLTYEKQIESFSKFLENC